MRTKSLLLMGAIVVACGVGPSGTPGHIDATPAGSATLPTTTTAAAVPSADLALSPAPITPPSPTNPFPPPPEITDRIDVEELLSRTTCSGGPFGGDGSLEIWTLHCRDSGSSAAIVADGLREDLTQFGATIEEEGSITSHNVGNYGDNYTAMHLSMDDMHVIVRIYLLPTGSDSSVVVVNIDQIATWPYWLGREQ